MVKFCILIFFMVFALLFGQSSDQLKEPCSSLIIQKARANGIRSLKLTEKIQYHIDLKKCNNKDFVKIVKDEVNKDQLVADAYYAQSFTGKSSSYAYCILTFIVILILV